jgi:hypothetical protein
MEVKMSNGREHRYAPATVSGIPTRVLMGIDEHGDPKPLKCTDDGYLIVNVKDPNKETLQ